MKTMLTEQKKQYHTMQIQQYLFFEFLFTLANPRNLRVCVNNRRYAVVVNVCGPTADVLNTKNA